MAAGSAAGTIGPPTCRAELVVLGSGQDGGAPQLGHDEDPAWEDSSLRRTATSLGLWDHHCGRRWLFEATPDLREQLQVAPCTPVVEHRFTFALTLENDGSSIPVCELKTRV